ncbi:MAG: restriction endonuclease subunit S [Alphaproteobacteria bacterium]|nr:restriction endonuclease subunit S [Alphaproteobacteria bacterium]MBU1513250.1 restriction endonuclease subunit S [Alphaproteobacteria bacterium]MBU2095358.1 restriction endonuclease subunit S [Alphaproteobacteria bacterium]MBU2152273.1 restriction endonuclease subunit S [Alphaproteobacteria bacterium]MBU2306680.1 restriction endonuclease subunit S [Alphaproteobacteria bacterium]
MKAGWLSLTLSDVCTKITDGTHHSPKTIFADPGDGRFLYVTSKNVRNDGLDLCEVGYISRADHDPIFSRCNPELGDILLTKDGANTGNVCPNTIEEPFSLLSSVCLLKPDRSKIEPQYLLYYLQSEIGLSQIVGQMTGAAIKRIILKTIKAASIQLPPLEEQRRIVGVLDEAFAAIATATANAEKNLANARELFQGFLETTFAKLADEAPVQKIAEIAEIKGGKRVPKGYKLLSEPTPYAYLTVGDFTDDGTIDPSGVRFVSAEIHQQIRRYIVREADLYVSIAGTIGRTGIVPPKFDGAQLTENACRLVFKQGMSNRFVYYFTKSPSFAVQAIEQTRTAAQPKLALSRLEKITLPVPKLDRQLELVSKFNTIENETASLAEVCLQKRAAFAALRQALLHRAFSGELTAAAPKLLPA